MRSFLIKFGTVMSINGRNCQKSCDRNFDLYWSIGMRRRLLFIENLPYPALAKLPHILIILVESCFSSSVWGPPKIVKGMLVKN